MSAVLNQEVMSQAANNFQWTDTGNVSWYDNAPWPVQSQPLCGFEGEACSNGSKS